MANVTALLARKGELQQQISDLLAVITANKRTLARLESALPFTTNQTERERLQSNIARLKEQIAEDERELARLYQELADLDIQIARVQEEAGPRYSAGETVVQAQRANDDRADTISPGAEPPPLAGATRTNADQFVPDENFGLDDPTRPVSITQSLPPITARPGGARRVPVNENDVGQQVPVFSRDDANLPTQQVGVGSPRDDAGGGSGVVARINSLFGGSAGRIIPQSNALDAYASYTYTVSIYLMNSDDYKTMLRRKTLSKGFQLLIQSGGAPVAGGQLRPVDLQETQQTADGNSAAIAQPDLGRNQFFPLDFYIDDLAIHHLTPNRGTGGPHSATNLTFKIFEPNGITFLPNLYKAVQQYVSLRGGPASVTQNQVYSSQNFLMVIRFYGYDANGNLVTAQNVQDQINSTTGTVLQTAGNATIEKYIPFQFTEIKFRIANKITEYECSAVCPQNIINTSNTRGVIPYNIELSSQSLRELLTGPIAFVSGTKSSGAAGQVLDTGDETARLISRTGASSIARQPTNQNTVLTTAPSFPPNTGEFGDIFNAAPVIDATGPAGAASRTATTASGTVISSTAPPKADAATRARSLTISQGLQEALNRFQAEISGPGDDKPQLYPDIYEIEIAEDVIKNASLVPPGEFNPRQSAMIKAQTAKETKDGRTQSVDTNSKTSKVLAGTPIVQFIDQVVRTSSYILDQQLFYIDSVTGRQVENASPAQTVGWFRIGLEAEPTGFYDTKRNDYQYRIKYSVAPYQVNQIKTDYFPRTQFQGTHKLYSYWFTGENTQILDFQQDYNYLYYITQNAAARPKRTSNYLEADRFYYQPVSNESSQGQENMTVYEGSAGAAAYLYSPSDQAEVKLNLVGDPAWIFQGEVWSGIQGLRTLYGAFLPDGTINPEGREILFEIVFNQPSDYDLSTGLIDAGQNNYGTNQAERQAGVYSSPGGKPRERFVYQARRCTSYFRQGKFTQNLEGVLVTFPLEDPVAGTRQQANEKKDAQVAAVNATSQSRTPTRTPGTSRPVPVTNQAATRSAGARPSPFTADSIRTEDFFPAVIEGAVTPLPQPAALAPTSATQVVGTASSGLPIDQTLGGATGRNVGAPPSVQLYLTNGQTVTVSSQAEILQYASQTSQQARSAALSRLSIAQQAANSPVTGGNRQLINRDT